MRNTQEIKQFIQKWKKFTDPSTKILYDYKTICRDLLLHDEELVVETIDILKRNISSWAEKNSEAYANKKDLPFLGKNDLINKDKWYVKSLENESMPMKSSGSTSGESFEYLRWEPFLYFIEGENHYDLILDEYEIPQNPHIMYFFDSSFGSGPRHINNTSKSKNFMEHHGTKRTAMVHYANTKLQKEKEEVFQKYLFRYLNVKKMDVIFAPGPQIKKLCSYIKKENYKGKLCNLLSNSNEKLLNEDAKFLLENNYVSHICDHMRCWDGGASFFTCRDKNYHLMDNLSWCVENEERLISTDYFSLACPFVKFWNGDRCKIGEKYQRCSCGRLYRDFKFLENRPFAIKGHSINEYKKKLMETGLTEIKQVNCGNDFIEIVSNREIDPVRKDEVIEIFKSHKLKFKVVPDQILASKKVQNRNPSEKVEPK